MKKYFLLTVLSIVFSVASVMAQSTQKKANELSKIASLKIQYDLVLDNSINMGKIYEVFETYYKAKALLTASMPQSEIIEKDNLGGFDALNDKRNESLKVLISTTQNVKWLQIAKTFTQSIVEVN